MELGNEIETALFKVFTKARVTQGGRYAKNIHQQLGHSGLPCVIVFTFTNTLVLTFDTAVIQLHDNLSSPDKNRII